MTNIPLLIALAIGYYFANKNGKKAKNDIEIFNTINPKSKNPNS
jgi:hypothetical protein